MKRSTITLVLLLALAVTAGVPLAQEKPVAEAKAPVWVAMPAAPVHKEIERNRLALAQKMAQYTVAVEVDYFRPDKDARVTDMDPFDKYDLGPFSGLVVANNQVMISDRCLGDFDRKGAATDVLAITVTMANGVRLGAKVVGRDQAIDLALLQVSGDMLAACPGTQIAKLPESEVKLVRGQSVTVVGRGQNPLSLLVNTGIVSAIGREGRRAFQLDARIGNSTLGAPVVDSAGNLVGMVTLHNHRTFGQASGVSMAAYLHEVGKAYSTLKEGKFIERPPVPYMGVASEKLWTDKPGLKVGNVTAGSGAQRAGVRTDDVMLQADGKDLHSPEDLARIIRGKKAGDRVKVKLLRGEQELELEVTLGRAP